jgi:hypothetical protein
MKSNHHPLLSALLLGLVAAGLPAAPAKAEPGEAPVQRVTVIFEHPEKFTDVKDNSTDFENERGREDYLPRFQEYLEQQAEKRLAPGQKLTVIFTDIDLAGDFEPWHNVQLRDVRIVRDRYPPRLAFRFTLTDAEGKTVKEGAHRLLDGGFMLGSSSTNNDSLHYEKEMLNDWLRKEFSLRKG